MKSELQYGEEVKIPRELFVSESAKQGKRLISSKYIGENGSGIIVDCRFVPAFDTKNADSFHYKVMINWASIWCGHHKVFRADGTPVRARRYPYLPQCI